MQKAIIMAQLCLYVAVLVPFFSTDILQLRGINIGLQGWLLALVGPVGCLILCEVCKLLTAYQMRKYQAVLAEKHGEEDRRLAAAAAAASRNVSGSFKQAPTKTPSTKAPPPTKVPSMPPAKAPSSIVGEQPPLVAAISMAASNSRAEDVPKHCEPLVEEEPPAVPWKAPRDRPMPRSDPCACLTMPQFQVVYGMPPNKRKMQTE
mmetsp:Transcript_3201/g.7281  ORF Transcript_3201/g.7281 Transcript_3201/m.7281 type:complete len:205 (-) Transcript_3201:36-650(-)